MKRARGRAAVITAAAALVLGLAAPAAAAEVSDPIIDGLTSPLGLAVGRDGTVYVAQTFAGALSEYRAGTLATLHTGEFPTGVDAIGRGNVTFIADGAVKVTNPSGKVRTLADVAGYEVANNPDAGNSYGLQGLTDDCRAQVPADLLEFVVPQGGDVNPNPYAVAILPGGNRVVADAGGNTLLRVSPAGRVSTLAVLPPRPALVTQDAADEIGLPNCAVGLTFNFQFVPTDVELGPNGTLYVTSLPGGPEGPSALGARGAVFAVSRAGVATEVAAGFNGATDLAVAPDGTIFVAELFGGRVSQVTPAGPVTVAELDQPASIEYARGMLFVGAGVFGPGRVVTVAVP